MRLDAPIVAVHAVTIAIARAPRCAGVESRTRAEAEGVGEVALNDAQTRERGPAEATNMVATWLSGWPQGDDRDLNGRGSRLPALHLLVHLANHRSGEVPLSAPRTNSGRDTLEDEMPTPAMSVDGHQLLPVAQRGRAVFAGVSLHRSSQDTP